MALHPADPRKDIEVWCIDCKRRHAPTDEHLLCPTGEGHLHKAFPADLYIDFKGWRFTPPFHCMYCGCEVCPFQWAFSRSCGGCDVGDSHTRRLNVWDRRIFAGPRQLIDSKDPYFISEDRFLPLSDIEKHPVLKPPKSFIPEIPPLPEIPPIPEIPPLPPFPSPFKFKKK
jgi:hypothetical protein